MAEKVKCRCGKMTENIKSYTNKISRLRVTVCDDCATSLKLTNEEKYIIEPYIETANKERPKI